jgi:hypothetical protein
MPYATKNPNEDFVFFLKVLIFTLIIFYLLFGTYKIAFGFEGSGISEGQMGYYAAPYESSVSDGDYVIFEGTSGWYVLDGAPAHSYYGDIYKGTIGNSTILTGHSLGSTCDDGTCVRQQGDNWNIWSAELEQGDDFFIAIFKYHADCRTYFQTGSGSCPNDYGIYELKWGQANNDINFDEPQGFQYGNAPIDLDISGDYFIASSSIYWDGIQVEMTYYPPFAFGTTTPSVYYEYIVFQNSQNEGEGTFDSEVDDIEWTAAIDGSYAYRARFYYEVYDYMTYSEWIYDEGLYYWIFSTGDYNLEDMPTMEDYYATTTDFGLLGNMFRDVLVYLFKPNDSVLDFWRTIKDRVRDKPPFGYYALIRDAFDDLSFEATPAFALQTASSTASYIFTPLKNGLSWVLWILFGVWFLKRFVHFVV